MATTINGIGIGLRVQSDSSEVSLRSLMVANPQELFEIIEADRAHLTQFKSRVGEDYVSVEKTRERLLALPFENFVDRFGIYNRSSLVGVGSVSHISTSLAELGIWVGGEHTRKGNGSRAVELLVDYALYAARFSEVLANIVVGNNASRDLFVKSGFELKGTDWSEGLHVWQYVLKKSQDKSFPIA